MLHSAELTLARAYIWQYCAYVIRVHWMPRTGMRGQPGMASYLW
jgi:hypothetical protein